LQSVKPIQNFLHNQSLKVIESDQKFLIEDSSASLTQMIPCSSQYLRLMMNDEQQLNCDGFIISCEAKKISIVLKQYPYKDVMKKKDDQSILHAVASDVKRIFKNITPYDKHDCLDIFDLSDDKNSNNHCASIISMFINEKHFLRNIKELWVTLEQCTELFVEHFVKAVKQ